jgi:hypothetical protein
LIFDWKRNEEEIVSSKIRNQQSSIVNFLIFITDAAPPARLAGGTVCAALSKGLP